MVTCTKCDQEIIDEPFTVAKRKYYHAACFIEQQEVKVEVSDPKQQQKITELEYTIAQKDKEIEELNRSITVGQGIISTLTKEQKRLIDKHALLQEKHKQLFDKVKPFIDLISQQGSSD